jgi:hypothetical protein
VTIQKTQARPADPTHQLPSGDEVGVIERNQTIAKVVADERTSRPSLRPPPGLGWGIIAILSADDEHLKDFAEP